MLGPLAEGKSDSEIEQVRDNLRVFAELAVESLIKEKDIVIDNNIDNININNIDKSIDRPREEIEYEARRIAEELGENDDDHIGFYIKTVKKLPWGIPGIKLSEVKEDMRIAEEKGKRVRNPAALFNWKIQEYQKKHQL